MTQMSVSQQIITIALCAAATMLTRFLPFLIFSSGKPVPKYVRYLGRALPCALFGMLVVYCLRNVDFLSGNHGVPEAVSVAVTALLHKWRKNMLLSIAGGTACYMVMMHFL